LEPDLLTLEAALALRDAGLVVKVGASASGLRHQRIGIGASTRPWTILAPEQTTLGFALLFGLGGIVHAAVAYGWAGVALTGRSGNDQAAAEQQKPPTAGEPKRPL
jgi:hypothetical protein